MLTTALLAGAVSIAALAVSGFSLRLAGDQPPEASRDHEGGLA
jgi:hypothetical protein